MGCTLLGSLLTLCINFFHTSGLYIPPFATENLVCPYHCPATDSTMQSQNYLVFITGLEIRWVYV